VGEQTVRIIISGKISNKSAAGIKFALDERERGNGVNTTPKQARPKAGQAIAEGGPLAAVPARDIHGGHTPGICEAAPDIKIEAVLEHCTYFDKGIVVGNPHSFAPQPGAEGVPLTVFPAGNVVELNAVDPLEAPANEHRIVGREHR
jgi:hypothetical protein